MTLLTEERYNEYDEFVKSHPKGHFLQCKKWAKVKEDYWKNEVILSLDGNGKIKGSMSVLIRKLPFLSYTVMYSPRGPVCDIHDRETIAELTQSAVELAKRYKSYVLKVDPDISIENKEFIEIMKSIGYKTAESTENFESIQPRFVFRLNVKDRTEEELLGSFESKTRYNIRLAAKKGVTVRLGTKADLPEFHKIMEITGMRDGFVVRSLPYFEKMYDCLGDEHARIYVAEYEGQMLSGAFSILYGDKVWYLYGASSNEHRNLMPNYLMQWEMIRWAVAEKCAIYDFRGVSGSMDKTKPLYGLFRFKKGFNGDFVEFCGEMNYIINPFIFKAVDKGEKLFKEIRRQLYLMKNGKKSDQPAE